MFSFRNLIMYRYNYVRWNKKKIRSKVIAMTLKFMKKINILD